jgi:predicted RNA-binding protein with TRAM domain
MMRGRRFGGGSNYGRGGSGYRKSGSFGRESFEKPIKEGEEYDVQITEVGSKGDGIAKIKNFVIFVPGTSKGENVKIRITQVKARSAVAEVVGAATKTESTETAAKEPAEETAESEEESTAESAEEESEEETFGG